MTGPGGFKDHFSAGAVDYARYRPGYPAALFEWIAGEAPARDLAWDCGTGSGQAAGGLAACFARVVATDASPQQLASAPRIPNVDFRVATAEASGLDDRSVDAVTVAQALHWFDRPRFFAEVTRVVRPQGVLVCWMYNRLRVDEAVDDIVVRFYRDVVGPWWPGDRKLIDDEYRPIQLPGASFVPPAFSMTAHWTLAHLTGYLRTWSAVARYREDQGIDPVSGIEPALEAAWGDPGRERTVAWPLVVLASRIP